MTNEQHAHVEHVMDRHTLTVRWPKKTPHWQRWGNGHASLEFKHYKEHPAVWLEATEYGEKSGKRVMLELNKESAAAIVRYLQAFL